MPMDALALVSNFSDAGSLIVFTVLWVVLRLQLKGMGFSKDDLAKIKDWIFSLNGLIALMILLNLAVLCFIAGIKP